MIVIDSSALMSIIGGESTSEAMLHLLAQHEERLIAAATLTEFLIVASRRRVHQEAMTLVEGSGLTIVPVTEILARDAAEAYRRWGKGFHTASLNFGDCFAYALARERDCPLLYVGEDFGQTDIASAL